MNDNEEHLMQCQHCGHIHSSNVHTEDGFVRLWCPYCEQISTQLDVENENDKYIYLNLNIDSRYF